MGLSFLSYKSGINCVKLQEFENLRELKPIENQLEKVRKSQADITVNAITDIRGNLETLKTEVYNNLNNHSNNTDYLRKKMYNIEEKIIHLKENIKAKLIFLLKDEMSLNNELDTLKGKLEDWGKPLYLKISKPNRQSARKAQTNISDNPMTEFQKFLLDNGGHYGGWEEYDHLLFLKERKKYKGKTAFISAVQSSLPDLSYEDIAEHEKWYSKYEFLKQSQKAYIQKWREEKINQQNQKVEEAKPQDKRKNVGNKAQHQRNITERIRIWKEQQLTKKKEEEERLKLEKEKLLEEENKKKEIQKRKKSAVDQYKAEKLKKIQQEISSKGENQIVALDSKTKKALRTAFRLQDLKFVEKRKCIHLVLHQKASEKTKRFTSVKPLIEPKRDPRRVFQPTLIWTQHCQQNTERKENVHSVIDLNRIPRLGVPEWRKELVSF